MKKLIRKILKESEEEFGWIKDLVPDHFNYEPGAIYYKFGGNEEVKSYILKKIVDGFNDLRISNNVVILEVGDWCDFADLFQDDSRGSAGYINRYLAKQVLCGDGDWWSDYGANDIIDWRQWKSQLWDDYVMNSERVVKEILNHIKKNYVSSPDYNPKQLDIYGNLPEKQNVVEIKGRILDTDYFYELQNDLNELGTLINKEDEFDELKKELTWAYVDAYNTAARDQVWNATKDAVTDIFGENLGWKSKEITKNGNVTTKHHMEFDVTNIFWESVYNFFDMCIDNRIGKQSVNDYTLEELEENFDECMTPNYQYGYFLEFYSALLEENNDELNPRYQEWPDDDDILKYFTESVMDRI